MKKVNKILLLAAIGISLTFGLASCSDSDNSDSDGAKGSSSTIDLKGALKGTTGTVKMSADKKTYVFTQDSDIDFYKGDVKSVADAYLYLSIKQQFNGSSWDDLTGDDIIYDYLALAKDSASASASVIRAASDYKKFKAYPLEAEDYNAGTIYKVYEDTTTAGAVVYVVAPATNKYKKLAGAVGSYNITEKGDCKLSSGKLYLKSSDGSYSAITMDDSTGKSTADSTASIDDSKWNTITPETIEAPADESSSNGNNDSGNSGSGGQGGEGEHEHGQGGESGQGESGGQGEHNHDGEGHEGEGHEGEHGQGGEGEHEHGQGSESGQGETGGQGGQEEKPTSYTVIYNGNPIQFLSESEYESYAQMLTAGTDYSISGTTITLTESGYAKVMQAMGGEGHEGEHGQGGEGQPSYPPYPGTEGGQGETGGQGGQEEKPTSYTVIYNGNPIQFLSESEYESYAQMLTAGTDYSISGTTITLTESGYAKVMQAMGGEGHEGEHGQGGEGQPSYPPYPGTEGGQGTEPVISGNNITLIYVYGGQPLDNPQTIPVEGLSYMTGIKIYSDAACTQEVPLSSVVAGNTYYSPAQGASDTEYPSNPTQPGTEGGEGLPTYPSYPGTEDGEGLPVYDPTQPEHSGGAHGTAENMYRVVYNGTTLTTLTDKGMEAYASQLTLGTDYSFDESTMTITLTESGYNKVAVKQ